MSTFFLRVPLNEKVLFTKNLALSLRAGVSLVNSLKMLKKQTKSRSFKKILDVLIEDTNKGVFLSQSLGKFRKVFGELFINIIKIGESSGGLPENLLHLGDELKKKRELYKKVKGAMIYPIIILIATVVIAASMIVFVFPKILPLFQNLGADLPFTTRLLINISSLVSNYGIFLLAGFLILFVGFRFLITIPAVRFIYHRILLFAPIFNKAIVNFNMANIARTLGMLFKSGVQIIESINITSATLMNRVYKKELLEAADGVRKGEFFSKYLSANPGKFPVIFANMVEVGENTGNLTDNLFYLAEYYENEVDDFVKNLSGILEPVLLLVMGGVVAFIALSFITPIYQLTRSIK